MGDNILLVQLEAEPKEKNPRKHDEQIVDAVFEYFPSEHSPVVSESPEVAQKEPAGHARQVFEASFG